MTRTRTANDVRADLATLRQTARRYDRVHNEGAEGFNPHARQIADLEAELDRLASAEVTAAHQAKLAAEDMEWTREVTTERRAAWNAWVRSQGPRVTPAQVATQVQRQGWDTLQLKRHITRHGL